MKKMLIICALAFTSCAPLLQTIQGEAGSLSRDGTSILLNNPGPGPMAETVVRVEGTDLILGAPCVYRAPNVYGCIVGDVLEGSRYRITPILDLKTNKVGTITKASANFYRGTSALFRRLELP